MSQEISRAKESFRSEAELTDNFIEETQAAADMGIIKVYKQGEKARDEETVEGRNLLAELSAQYITQLLYLNSSPKITDRKRLDHFSMEVQRYLKAYRVHELEEFFKLARSKDKAKLAKSLRDMYVEVFGWYVEQNKMKMLGGKTPEDLIEQLRSKKEIKEITGIKGGPNVPKSALGRAESKTDQVRGISSGGGFSPR